MDAVIIQKNIKVLKIDIGHILTNHLRKKGLYCYQSFLSLTNNKERTLCII